MQRTKASNAIIFGLDENFTTDINFVPYEIFVLFYCLYKKMVTVNIGILILSFYFYSGVINNLINIFIYLLLTCIEDIRALNNVEHDLL